MTLLGKILYRRLHEHAAQTQHTVYDSVAQLCACYEQVLKQYDTDKAHEFSKSDESLVDWLNREQRLEDWQEELEQMQEQLESPRFYRATDAWRGRRGNTRRRWRRQHS